MLPHLVSSLLLFAGVGAGSAPDTSTALVPTRYEMQLRLDPSKQLLDGDAAITVRNRSSQPATTAALLLYRLMRVSEVHDASGAPLPFTQEVIEFLDHPALQVRQIVVTLPRTLSSGDTTVLRIRYGGALLGYTETGMSYVRDRIDSAYSLVRMDAYAYPELYPPSHTLGRRAELPSYDYHVLVTVPDGYTVANGGELLGKRTEQGWTTFEYRNTKPAWRMDFASAHFAVKQSGAFKVFYLPEDSLGGARVLSGMSRGIDLFTRWFGPLRGNPAFTVIEVPDGCGSQADVSSIIQQAGAFRKAGNQYELYHELSHLWNVTPTDFPNSHWEGGLATFLEDLATDSLDAKVTTEKNADWQIGRLRGMVASDTLFKRVPLRDYGRRQLTDYSYPVGSPMFYSLYRLMGHDAFTRLIAQHYARHATGGSLAEFVSMAKAMSPVPLDSVFSDWVETTHWADVIATTTAAELPGKYR